MFPTPAARRCTTMRRNPPVISDQDKEGHFDHSEIISQNQTNDLTYKPQHLNLRNNDYITHNFDCDEEEEHLVAFNKQQIHDNNIDLNRDEEESYIQNDGEEGEEEEEEDDFYTGLDTIIEEDGDIESINPSIQTTAKTTQQNLLRERLQNNSEINQLPTTTTSLPLHGDNFNRTKAYSLQQQHQPTSLPVSEETLIQKYEFSQPMATKRITKLENSQDQLTHSKSEDSIENSSVEKQITSNQQQSINQARKMTHQDSNNLNKQQIPSTNRLLIEHQAREKQALFKAIYRRQRMMDELGAERPEDLLSASSWQPATSKNSSRRHQHHNKRGKHKHRSTSRKGSESQTATIPLSSVDFSSISDGMLDNLLGHLAPASSVSSLSSHGESVSSSSSSSGDANCCSTDLSPACSGSDSGSCNDSDGEQNHRSNKKRSDENCAKLRAASCNRTAGSSTHRRTSLSKKRSNSESGSNNNQQKSGHNPASDSSDLDCQATTPGIVNNNKNNNHHHHHHHSSRRRSSSSNRDWLPNVVGIHEDEHQWSSSNNSSSQQHNDSSRSSRNAPFNCRENTRDRFNKKDDDSFDDRRDRAEQLSVRVGENSGANHSSMVMSGPTSSEQLSLSPEAIVRPGGLRRGTDEEDCTWTTRLNSLAAGNNASSQSDAIRGSPSTESPMTGIDSPTNQQSTNVLAVQRSVEGVLEGLLEAINDVGAHEYVKLDELLENGFLQLEQLLNCPTSSPQSYPQPISSSASHSPSSSASKAIPIAGAIGGGGVGVLSNISLMSKDSDYGSDTQSGVDCFSHLTSSSQSTSAASTANRSQSDSPSFSTGKLIKQQQQLQQQIAPLSGLAVELMYKLHESLRNISHQRATSHLKQPQQEQTQSEPKDNDGPRSSSTNKSNTTSSAPNEVSQNSSVVLLGAESSSASPESTRSSPNKNCFKTCIEIGKGGHVSIINNDQRLSNIDEQIQKQQHINSRTLGAAERSRPGRSSIRRRPSFSGSLGGRAGSPVPRSILEVNSNQTTADMMVAKRQQNNSSPFRHNQSQQQNNDRSLAGDEREEEEQQHKQQQQANQQANNIKNHQRQLQRALVYAQKYDFSPAKMASSKLGSKLQLGNQKNPQTYDPVESGHLDVAAIPATYNQQQSQQQQQDLIGGALKITGQVQLEITYHAATGELVVQLIQCSQLAAVNRRRQTSNPYVKIYLLPDRSKAGKRKSNVVKAQVNPYFNQSFSFGPLRLEEFDSKQLWLSVLHQGSLSRTQFLGAIVLPLAQVKRQLLSSQLTHSTGPQWYPLQSNKLCLLSETSDSQRKVTTSSTSNRTNKQFEVTSSAKEVNKSSMDQHQTQQRYDQLDSQSVGSGGTGNSGSIHNVQSGISNQSNNGPQSDLITGQLFVSLKFMPAADGSGSATLNNRTMGRSKQRLVEGDLHVMIKQAQGIGGFDSNTQKAPPTGSLPNPIAKCCLMNANNQRICKEKTPQLRRTSNPRWDHTCIFKNLKLDQLVHQSLEISIYSSGDSILVSNSYLGSVRLSCPASMISSSSTTTSSALGASASSNQIVQQAASMTLNEPNSGYLGDSISNSSGPSAGDPQNCNNSLSSFQTISTGVNSLVNQNTAMNNWPSSDQEREWRLWATMLTKPKIWSYAELNLRNFRSQQQQN